MVLESMKIQLDEIQVPECPSQASGRIDKRNDQENRQGVWVAE
jgi:hypothetical protein